MIPLQTRNRFLIIWVMFSAFWLAGLCIAQAGIRPAPVFAVMAPLAVGGPLGFLLIGLLILKLRSGGIRQKLL